MKYPNEFISSHSVLLTKVIPNKFRNLLVFIYEQISYKNSQFSFWLAQSPNSPNLHLYHIQIFPPRENSNNECKSFSPLLCFYSKYIFFGVTWCTLLMGLYLDRMCQYWLHAVLWSHIGTLMHRFAAEPRSTAGILFPSQCASGTILLTPYSMLWDWRVSRAGPMLF